MAGLCERSTWDGLCAENKAAKVLELFARCYPANSAP
jgi:hypothetical protein